MKFKNRLKQKKKKNSKLEVKDQVNQKREEHHLGLNKIILTNLLLDLTNNDKLDKEV